MNKRPLRRERLHKLLDLARVYRRWTRVQLARALGRDPCRIYPNTDNPRLDFLVGLADALEWSLDAVVEHLWSGDAATPQPDAGVEFATPSHLAMHAERDAQFRHELACAAHMLGAASSPQERALALQREYMAWEGMGRYSKALSAVQRALQEAPLPSDLRLALRAMLANALYCSTELTAAQGVSHTLVDWFARHSPKNLREAAARAMSHYIRGSAAREFIGLEPEFRTEYAAAAMEDLTRGERLFSELAAQHQREDFEAVANTCRGGTLEAQVELGRLSVEGMLDRVLRALPDDFDEPRTASAHRLESCGWWCVFGSNVALRHARGRVMQQTVAVLGAKLEEIAEALNHWSFRRHAVLLDYRVTERLGGCADAELPLTIDEHDLRTLVGAMGRFPGFRPFGWKILRTAMVVKDPGIRNN